MVMVDSFPFNTFVKDLKDGFVPEIFFQNRILKSLNPKWSLKEAREKLRKMAEKESISKIPEDSELANMVVNDANMVVNDANMVTKVANGLQK
ncbi:hypothetical protein TNCV_4837371 [Trichonephila clavipes]|nr:hypothetical protein TNCV_4837371 [Trichonephila clavipes]